MAKKSFGNNNKELKKKLGNKALEGRISKHPDGFGFFIPTESDIPHLYVHKKELVGVMDKDTVLARPKIGDNFSRAEILEVIKRGQQTFLGVIKKEGFKDVLVIPTNFSDRDFIFRATKQSSRSFKKLKNKAVVLASVVKFPSHEKDQGSVDIIEEIKDPSAPSVDTLKVMVAANWPREFPKVVLDQAEDISKNWKNRIDSKHKKLQHLKFVTIDGRDAKDFDDAVFAQKEKNGDYRLWVAIADVSLFVIPGTELDGHALKRSTSVYLPDLVIPMLPEVLSNGLCSLNPNEDRPSMVCEMLIDQSGKCKDYKFYEAVIKSHHRLTYQDMQGFMDKQDWAIESLSEIQESLSYLNDVFKILLEARQKRNALDLDTDEPLVILNEDASVKEIVVRKRIDAHKLIEECMLKANECAANFIKSNKKHGVYRVHAFPSEEPIKNLIAFILKCGVNLGSIKELKTDEPINTVNVLNKLIRNSSEELNFNDPRLGVIKSLTLRCMKPAYYGTEALGHYALCLDDYTHFTSPIRRYPDLLVHRLIKDILKIQRYNVSEQELKEFTSQSSFQERQAMDCERKVIDIKKARFADTLKGQSLSSTVVGISDRGIYCKLDDYFVDGFVSSDKLKEKFMRFFEKELCFRGKGKTIELGTQLIVSVDVVKLLSGKIDFNFENFR